MQTPESSPEAPTNCASPTSQGSGKGEARQFLQAMESFLTTELPVQSRVCTEVDEEVALAIAARKKDPKKKHNYISFPEGAFFKRLGVEYIYRFLHDKIKMQEEEARTALLSESFRHHRNFSSNSPRSKEKYPFTKDAGEKVGDIAARWWSEDQKHAFQQSCPDLALRPPSPHRNVIKGKYFRNGSYGAAGTKVILAEFQVWL
jgi:hypothetical protein